jgi:hypothetical protein
MTISYDTPRKHLTQLFVSGVMAAVTTRRSSLDDDVSAFRLTRLFGADTVPVKDGW